MARARDPQPPALEDAAAGEIELGPFGGTSNVVAPGYVVTAMLRQGLADMSRSFAEFEASAAERVAVGRLGRPEDIAAAVAYFSLPESGFVTGETLYAAGNAQKRSNRQLASAGRRCPRPAPARSRGPWWRRA